MCVSICECVWVSESLSGRLEPVWSACSCTTERKEARRTEGERERGERERGSVQQSRAQEIIYIIFMLQFVFNPILVLFVFSPAKI